MTPSHLAGFFRYSSGTMMEFDGDQNIFDFASRWPETIWSFEFE